MPAASSAHSDAANQIVVPHNAFAQPDNSPDIEPPPPPQMNALQQMMQERQKNWAQMTPEEIFGLKAPDKSANPAKLVPAGTDGSPLEKFLMEQRLVQTGTTNLNTSPGEGWNFLDPESGLPNPNRVEAMRNGSIMGSPIFDRWLDNARDVRTIGNQDDSWAHVFNTPQQSEPSAAETASMDAFRQLLNPSASTSDSGSASDSSRSKSLLPTVQAMNPDLNPLPVGFNPVGASVAPLQPTVGRPNGINPLPGVVSVPEAPETPSWAPQAAPWTSGKPQLFVTPQRKY